MKARIEKYQHYFITIILVSVLLVYFSFICFLNLSLTPSFYCTDMYSDILYAVRAWETKSIFPDGWVFGNQFYVIATPVLSALIYGISGQAALSMAIASIVMTLGIALSLLWMLKPVFTKWNERLIALLGLVTLTAYCGDAIYSINGWQLLFTMCSYYACYLITAFLCFGCFLRRREALTPSRIAMLVLTLLLCFGAGMQSLRQTAIMLPPILCLEVIAQLKSLIKQKKLLLQPLVITFAMSLANLLGLLLIRLLNVPQHEIFYATQLLPLAEIPVSLNNALNNLTSLLIDQEYVGLLLLAVIAVCVLGYFQAKWQKSELPQQGKALIVLFFISVLGIFAIDMFTRMTVRSIYYFMLFPLIAILITYAYSRWKCGRVAALALLAILVVASFQNTVLPTAKIAKASNSNISYEISDMLIEKGYTTVYSGWNQCEDIAIASNGRLTAGFWNRSKDVFCSVEYLCDPSIYETDASKCVYYLRRDNRDIALKAAKERGATMTLVAAYPEWGIWLYESSENLMTLSDE